MSDLKGEILHKADVIRDNQERHTFPQVKIELEYPPAHLVEVSPERLIRKIQRLNNEQKLQILQFLWCELNGMPPDPKGLNQPMESNFESAEKIFKPKSPQNLIFFVATTLFLFGVKIILTTYSPFEW